MDNKNSVPKGRAAGKRKKTSTDKPTLIIFDFKAKRKPNPAMSKRAKLMAELNECIRVTTQLQEVIAGLIWEIEAEDKKGGGK